MENAVDALKLAFALLVFVIAVALTFSIVGQAKATSDTILAINDKTSLYEYVETSEENASNKDRIVGFETILPTIYRYAKEQYAVTILDTDGTPIVRYDLYTEGFMQRWDEILKNVRRTGDKVELEEIRTRIQLVDDVIQKETGKQNAIWSSMTTDSYQTGDLYSGSNENNSGITTVAPWMGNANIDAIDRIKADLEKNGKYKKNGITYKGKNLSQYKESKFKEKFIEIQTSGTTITETDAEDQSIQYSLETVRGNKKLEIIYILQ